MRIVSLVPSATEIVFALGRGGDLVGVTFECDWPPEARTRRVVSTSALPEGLDPAEIDRVVAERTAAGEDLYRLDAGALAELDPDVVLTQDLCAVCALDLDDVDEALAYLGCTAEVVTLDPSRLDDVLGTIEVVGRAVDAEEAASAVVTGLRARLARLAEATGSARSGSASRRVLVLEWTDPPFSAGHWVPDLVTAAGGEAVLASVGGRSGRVSWDDVRDAGADVVLVAPCGFGVEGAGRQARAVVDAGLLPPGAEVWALDADSYVVRPGPRLVDGAELIGQVLHPSVLGAPEPARAIQVPVDRTQPTTESVR